MAGDMTATEFATPLTHSRAEVSDVGDFFALLKPRVMSLVVFSGLAGLLLAPGNIHPLLAMVAILCIAVGSGAAGCINMWYERDIDAIMERTKNRPIPKGKIAPADALSFGVCLAIASVVTLGIAVNWVAASLLMVAILFYVFIYTIWLKPRTPQNIVIGGAAGAFPPMIGWAAVTGDISLSSIALFMLIFFWTPPHFWALALYKNDDYRRANIPMLPVIAGGDETRKQMIIYSLFLLPASLAPVYFGVAGVVYGAVAAVLSSVFIMANIGLYRRPSDAMARRIFTYSIFYLFALFTAMIADSYHFIIL
jgi:protoheme IX farnesyltransferase